jgi:hypothetical protein
MTARIALAALAVAAVLVAWWRRPRPVLEDEPDPFVPMAAWQPYTFGGYQHHLNWRN